MKRNQFPTLIVVTIAAALSLRAAAEVVYTSVEVSIPNNGYYNLDLNHDGISDFTLRSALLQDYCQSGDGYVWSLTLTPSSGNAVVTAAGLIGDNDASVLPSGAPVSSGQNFYPNASLMAELSWGSCGIAALGEWLNIPYRYLGLEFHGSNNEIHYGWAKVSNVAYVDRHGHLHTSTVLSGFAYETVPGQAILAGQTTDAP
jgi:hypothetical protein